MPFSSNMDTVASQLTNGVHDKDVKRSNITRLVHVNSPDVKYTEDGFMVTNYQYQSTHVTTNQNGEYIVTPVKKQYCFKTNLTVPKMGLMLVGWGGNNGSTVTAGILANKHNMSWRTRTGIQTANYYGSLTQSATFRLGAIQNKNGDSKEVYVPFFSYLPMVNPNDLIIGGWDINGKDLAESMERAQVLEPDLQRQLFPYLTQMKPLPSIYYPDFIAANQSKRADNLIPGESKRAHLDQVREDIRQFKANNQLDTVVVVWTATTERFVDLLPGVNDTAENLMKSIESSHSEISPSTIFAMASILENAPFINGSPQNTFVPGVIDLADRHGAFVAGDDFKTGQTKLKSVLVDFLVGAGIKPLSITSYNHLGNNDGENLSAPKQFRSKEISKSNVVDDMVSSNSLLYSKSDEHPDHVVVIKYIPAVGDSKRAMDEYYNEIFLGGRNTIVIHNTCEDSLLAAPLIIDLALVAELFTRITFKTEGIEDFKPFHSVLSILTYFLKAPLVPNGAPVINALFRQRQAIENILRACIGLPPQNEMSLESRCV